MDTFSQIDNELNRQQEESHERFIDGEISIKEYNKQIQESQREARAEYNNCQEFEERRY